MTIRSLTNSFGSTEQTETVLQSVGNSDSYVEGQFARDMCDAKIFFLRSGFKNDITTIVAEW